MRIQYFSDIHLEFGNCEFPVTDADILIAAGDIGVGTEAVDWLAQAPCPVIYVAGNHEYYTGDLHGTRKHLEQECARAKVDFLDNVRADLGDVRFLGTTLWTDFNTASENIMEEVEHCMNDYQYIQMDGLPLTAGLLLKRHRDSLAWLESELADPFKGKTVVVTHHAPSMKSWYSGEDYKKDVRRYAYCSELSDLIRKYPIDAWFHGHVHCVSDYRIGDVRVLCNPRGYHGHQQIEGYDPHKIIEI